MGIINGGPFGAMKNKTGNLVFRKVSRKNVVTIYVPNPRDPKTAQQLYFRSIIQRIGYEMSTGLANAACALKREKHDNAQPESIMTSKTSLKYNKAELPEIIFPQFEPGRLHREIPTQNIYNPFFDCFSFPLLRNNITPSGKLPLHLVIGYNKFSGVWVVMPDCVCKMDGFQGNCYEGGQIGENTYEVTTYANYLYCGIEFWLEIDYEQGLIDGNNYNNDINPNFLPGNKKLSTDFQNLPIVVVTDENLMELRNYVPGVGYTNKMRKGTLFTPTMLNKLSGKTIDHSQPSIFNTSFFGNIPFGDLFKLDVPINNNNLYPAWEENTYIYLDTIDTASVEAALGTSNILYCFSWLSSTSEHVYVCNGNNFEKSSIPESIKLYDGSVIKPVSLMVSYKNIDTGIYYLDFVKHWFKPGIESPLSQMEYYYNNIPQRYRTPGGNPGMWLTIYKNVSGSISRAAGFSVELFFAGTVDTITLESDNLGNCIHEFTGEEMEIVGIGFDKNHIIKIKTGYNGAFLETDVDILVSGKCYSSFGTITQQIIP